MTIAAKRSGGRMSIAFCRVDMRLIHGQILNLWLLKMASRHVLIVDDELADDEFMTYHYRRSHHENCRGGRVYQSDRRY